jgi:DNA-binding response OmpR family regulator
MTNENVIKPRVLVLEDEPIIGQITSRTLTKDGYEVDVAINGLIAKQKIINNKYDIFVFDIRTPQMNGVELYEFMEQNFPELTRRVIFATGDCLGPDTKAFLDRVQCLYLGKPYTPSELRNIVQEALIRDIARI